MSARCDSSVPKIPCLHRIADGVFRGAYIGVVWGGYFAHEHLREVAAARGAPLGLPNATLRTGRYIGANVAGFALFLGGYNALQCSLETVLGNDSVLTPAAAGATLGVLGGCVLPTRPTGQGILTGAVATALTCVLVTRVLMPAPSRTRNPHAAPARSDASEMPDRLRHRQQ
jgi:hypothetical protein